MMLMAILRFLNVTIFKYFIEDYLPVLLLIFLGGIYFSYFMEYWGMLMLLSVFLVIHLCIKILKWIEK